MKSKPSVRRIIIAVAVSAALLTAGFLLVNGIWGNPVSAAIADGKMNAYLKDKYPVLTLTDETKTAYDFINRTYCKTVKTPGSADVFFSVRYYDGRVTDDYESSELSGSNTLTRLSREYSALASKVLSQSLKFQISDASVLYLPGEGKDLSGVIHTDMAFDKSLPIDAELTVNLMTDSLAPSDLAKLFVEIHTAVKAGGCAFVRYSIAAESGKALAVVNGVTPEDIESGDLESRIDAAFGSRGAGSIDAFRKG